MSIAQILGASDVNNRRDHLTGVLLSHAGWFMQVVEGGRPDLDRLIGRLRADPRHRKMAVLFDGPVGGRRFGSRAMAQAEVTDRVEALLAGRYLRTLTLAEAEAVFLASEATLDLAG